MTKIKLKFATIEDLQNSIRVPSIEEPKKYIASLKKLAAEGKKKFEDKLFEDAFIYFYKYMLLFGENKKIKNYLNARKDLIESKDVMTQLEELHKILKNEYDLQKDKDMPFNSDHSLNTSNMSTSSLLCDEQYIQTFTKQLLQKQIFMGRYTSRQYVDQIQGYRDLVVIEHNEDLEEVLRVVYEKLTDYYRDDKWIGITMPDFPGTPSAYCFWVQFNPNSVIQKISNTSVTYSQQRHTFEHGIPFGKYWFSVSSVKYKINEVIVKLKILRPTENENIFTDTTQRHSLQEENITSTGIDTNIDNIEYTITNIKLFYYSCKNNIYEFVQENVTKENIKEVEIGNKRLTTSKGPVISGHKSQ